MISMREAYEKIGANYDDACARLMGEGMLARFALKFLDDESMDKLEAAMAAGDAKEAFNGSAHAQGREPEPGIRQSVRAGGRGNRSAARCPMPSTAPVMECTRCSSNMRPRCRPCARWPSKSSRALMAMRVDNLPF